MNSTTRAVISTPVGPAGVVLEGQVGTGLVVLGHGAGRGGSAGGVEAPDLRAARDAGLALGLRVARVEQPWLVAGRAVAEAPPRLDAAWRAVVAAVQQEAPGPLVVGGRSSGARVACRTADDLGAAAVLALAFPLFPPGVRTGPPPGVRTGPPPGRPDRSRLPELLSPSVPRLVVQGNRDAFGCPEPSPGVEVHLVAGADHGFAVRRRDGRAPQDVVLEVRQAVQAWLALRLSELGPPTGQTLT